MSSHSSLLIIFKDHKWKVFVEVDGEDDVLTAIKVSFA